MKIISIVLTFAIAAIALAVPSIAAANAPERTVKVLLQANATDGQALTPSSRNVTRLLFHAPGERSASVLAIFRLHVTHIVPLPWRRLRERLRPYVLGGSTSIRAPTAPGLIGYANTYEESTTLHLGGGTELLIGDHLSLSLDIGEVLYGGSLRKQNHERYNLGLGWDF